MLDNSLSRIAAMTIFGFKNRLHSQRVKLDLTETWNERISRIDLVQNRNYLQAWF
jgi:hypothetical protein